MDDGTRATKRSRSLRTEPRLTIQAADDLWFRDGNIVLCALSSNSNSYHAFRVHKSVLSMHASVFRDMFDNDAVLDASSEQYAGVPLVDLHDAAEDVEDFLRAIYDSECVLLRTETKYCTDPERSWLYRHLNPALHPCTMYDYPKMYAGAMRLARKYDAKKMIDTFASGLRKVFPSKFDEALRVWDSFKRSARPREDDEGKTPLELKRLLLADLRLDTVHPDAGAHGKRNRQGDIDMSVSAYAIRLAVDLHIPDVLPAAFYYLSSGHSMINITAEGYLNPDEEQYPGDLDILRAEELRTYIRGSAALRAFLFRCSLKKDEVPSRSDFPEGRKHERCHEEMIRMVEGLGLVSTLR